VLLKHHSGAVILALVGVAAFFDAQGMMQVVGASLGADAAQLAVPPLVSPSPQTPGSASEHATSAEAILHRNPFDSETGPLDVIPQQAAIPLASPDCDGVTVLAIATSADPDWSFAALETRNENGNGVLRRRGDEVDGKQIDFIGWDRLWMTSGDRSCQARLFKPASAKAPPAAATPGRVPDDIRKGIQQIGPREYNVDRGVVDKILENQAELMTQVRIVPDRDNGRVVGIRLVGVRPDSLLGALGMQNGDRLQSINGFDLTSPEKALEAFARLPTTDHLTATVNRKGQDINLDYNIK
jgi:general secretion pathway protein C